MNQPGEIKVISPQEVDDLANRLKNLNDMVQDYTSDWDTMAKDQIVKNKKKLEDKINTELKDVKEKIDESLQPVLNHAKSVVDKYAKLIKIPTSPLEVVTWAKDVIETIFDGPYTKAMRLIASYAQPMARLTSELQRASNITMSTVSSIEDGTQLSKLDLIKTSVDVKLN